MPAASRRSSTRRSRSSAPATRSSCTRRTGRRSIEQVKLAEATPVFVRTKAADGFAITAAPMLDAMTRAHARHHHQLAVQPDGRADLGRGSRRRSRRRPRGAASGSCSTCATRSSFTIRRRTICRRCCRRHCPRSVGHLRVGVEGVRDDRLALRLVDRPGRGDCRAERDSEPRDVERVVDHAEGGDRGADRIAGAGRR